MVKENIKGLEELNNLHCMVNKPTRITSHSKSLLDVIFKTTPDLFKKCGTYEAAISDHRLIYSELIEKDQKHNT